MRNKRSAKHYVAASKKWEVKTCKSQQFRFGNQRFFLDRPDGLQLEGLGRPKLLIVGFGFSSLRRRDAKDDSKGFSFTPIDFPHDTIHDINLKNKVNKVPYSRGHRGFVEACSLAPWLHYDAGNPAKNEMDRMVCM